MAARKDSQLPNRRFADWTPERPASFAAFPNSPEVGSRPSALLWSTTRVMSSSSSTPPSVQLREKRRGCQRPQRLVPGSHPETGHDGRQGTSGSLIAHWCSSVCIECTRSSASSRPDSPSIVATRRGGRNPPGIAPLESDLRGGPTSSRLSRGVHAPLHAPSSIITDPHRGNATRSDGVEP